MSGADAVRRELTRYRWVFAVVPLAGAVASCVSFAIWMHVADRVLALDAFNDDEEAQL